MEQRISTMSSQLLMGSNNESRDYSVRVAELERERQLIEEDKLQVDRYKKLLLKQRYEFSLNFLKSK